jgi:high-affinity Fe2+/Pb2+ permease
VSKEIRARESKKPLTLRHAVGVTAVGVIAAIVAFWVLASIAGIIFFFVKLAVVVVLIGAVFWVISRFRR